MVVHLPPHRARFAHHVGGQVVLLAVAALVMTVSGVLSA
jgi:hypothetical protein